MLPRFIIYLLVILTGMAGSLQASDSKNSYKSLADMQFTTGWQLIEDVELFNSKRVAYISAADYAYKVLDDNCVERLQSWQNYADNNSVASLTHLHYCHNKLINYGYAGQASSGVSVPVEINELFLHWASTSALLTPANKSNVNFARFADLTNAAVGSTAAYYALFKEQFDYTREERALVETFLVGNLLYVEPWHLADRGKLVCDASSLRGTGSGLLNGTMSINSCGPAFWSLAQGSLLLGLRLDNQALINKGLATLDWLLHFFSSKGIYIPYAAGTGGYALDYMMTLPHHLGVFTEVLASLNYDFLGHKVPSGITVKQVLDKIVDIIKEPRALGTYGRATLTTGTIWRPATIRQRDAQNERQFEMITRASNAYMHWSETEALHKTGYSWVEFSRQSARYIDQYRPDLKKYRKRGVVGYGENGQQVDVVSSYSAIDPYMLYDAKVPPISGEAVKQARGASYRYVPKKMPASNAKQKHTHDILEELSLAITGKPAAEAKTGAGFENVAIITGVRHIDWYLIKANSADGKAILVGTDQINLIDNSVVLNLSEEHFYPTRHSREQLYIWTHGSHIAMEGELDIGYYGLPSNASLIGNLNAGFGFGYVGIYQDIVAFHIR